MTAYRFPLADLTRRSRFLIPILLAWLAGVGPVIADELLVGPVTPHPILFVTQVPLPRDFATINATFANHRANVDVSTRGGDLWIRYPDGGLKNLTQAAGYGVAGFQGASSIAVRDPAVHWDGTKAIFAMAIGAVEKRYELREWRWQLYEVSGLGALDTPIVTKVQKQPLEYNNVMPVYAADDRILFVSDRPFGGLTHLYPLLDEYERTPSNSGLWSLNPVSGELRHLDHAPSGDFHPLVDSYGRVVFTRWDHLERDQLADADAGPVSSCYGGSYYGSVNYSDESAAATWSDSDLTEYFPEPRRCRDDLLASTFLDGHAFNHFFPWMMRQDGSDLETLNHVGRHELHGYLARTFNNDPNVVEYYGQYARTNPRSVTNLFQIDENPAHPGRFLGIMAPEFGTHASGQVVELVARPSDNADDMVVTYVTHPKTASTADDPPPEHTGFGRDPLRLSDGSIVVSHTFATQQDQNLGTTEAPRSRYDYRLRVLVPGGGGYHVPGAELTSGISKSVSWWSPDVLVSYEGNLWELNPVEVRARARVGGAVATDLPAPEAQVFAAAGVDVAAFRSYLAANDLALVVARDVTSRDDADRQQPLNLRVPGGVERRQGDGLVYDVSHIQFFQADHLRGDKGCCASTPRSGRRVLARPLHDAKALACNPNAPGGPAGAKALGLDGSMAALVPARRALTWQLTDPTHDGVVRERNWLTFQPGEIRVCASCHGVNKLDQASQPQPENPPAALLQLLQAWAPCGPSRKDPVLLDLDAGGLWQFDDPAAWTSIHPADSVQVAVGEIDGVQGLDIVMDRGAGRGIWVLYNRVTWKKLHATSSRSMLAADLDANGRDEVVIDFGAPYGIRVFNNGATWSALHASSAVRMVAGQLDGTTGGGRRADLVIDFGAMGLWQYLNKATWRKVHSGTSMAMAVGDLDGQGQDDVMVDLGPALGISVYYNNKTWTKVRTGTSRAIAIGTLDTGAKLDAVIDLGAEGLWAFDNNVTWRKLHTSGAEGLVTADLDGDGRHDVVADRGATGGTWVYYNGLTWKKVHAKSPGVMARVRRGAS